MSERKGVVLKIHTRCTELKPKFGAMIGGILEAYSAQYKKKKRIC
jgi:hypothetical protein